LIDLLMFSAFGEVIRTRFRAVSSAKILSFPQKSDTHYRPLARAFPNMKRSPHASPTDDIYTCLQWYPDRSNPFP